MVAINVTSTSYVPPSGQSFSPPERKYHGQLLRTVFRYLIDAALYNQVGDPE